jgi:hypothetical protein
VIFEPHCAPFTCTGDPEFGHACWVSLQVPRRGDLVDLTESIEVPPSARIRRTPFCEMLDWRSSEDGVDFVWSGGTIRCRSRQDAFLLKMRWL